MASDDPASPVAPGSRSGGKESNQSLLRALKILDLFAESPREWGVREMARHLSLSPTIVQRLITTLAREGILEQSLTTQRYRVGLRLYQLGSLYIRANDLMSLAMPELTRLAENYGLSASLGTLAGDQMMYAAAAQARSPISVRVDPGELTDIHSTAFGKAILFDMDDAKILALLGPGPYRAKTARTLTSYKAFIEDIHTARGRGYAICDSENIDGVYAVAAPIYDNSDRIVASVSVAVPQAQLSTTTPEILIELTLSAVRSISQRLGSNMKL
jgi:IclR family KDG regulon transcriptional repressor